jgi:hypothetical protein
VHILWVAKTPCLDVQQCQRAPEASLHLFAQVLVEASSFASSLSSFTGQVLACSDTNASADNLAHGVATLGMRVVRVGNPAMVCPAH